MEPPNNGQVGDEHFVHCSEVVPSSEVEMYGHVYKQGATNCASIVGRLSTLQSVHYQRFHCFPQKFILSMVNFFWHGKMFTRHVGEHENTLVKIKGQKVVFEVLQNADSHKEGEGAVA